MDQRISFGAGLCATCRHTRLVTSDRGSQFVLCRRSGEDARYPRYPALPVRSCHGFEPADPHPPTSGTPAA